MPEPRTAAAADLHLSHGQLLVVDPGGPYPSSVRIARSNGLVGVEPGVAVILTGIHTGWIRVSVDLHDTPPPLELKDWEEVVEVSVDTDAGTMVASGLMSDPPPDLPVLTQAGPGTYRLRVHARGRDTAVDQTTARPVEFYRLSLWPAPPQPEKAHKLTDQFGHRQRAKRRDGPQHP